MWLWRRLPVISNLIGLHRKSHETGEKAEEAARRAQATVEEYRKLGKILGGNDH